MDLKDLLLEHSRMAGVPLNLDDQGQCHLVVNDEHIVNLEVGDADNFYFYSHVTRVPNIGNEALFKYLLQANLYGKRTQGTVFALDSLGTQVILFRELNCQYTDFQTYFTNLQAFVNQIGYWKQELPKLMASVSDTPGNPTGGRGPGGWIKL